jgi:hypothetical protein
MTLVIYGMKEIYFYFPYAFGKPKKISGGKSKCSKPRVYDKRFWWLHTQKLWFEI